MVMRRPVKSAALRGAHINDGLAAHEASRCGEVWMKVAVVFQAWNVAAQQGPHSFERRA